MSFSFSTNYFRASAPFANLLDFPFEVGVQVDRPSVQLLENRIAYSSAP
jgi:hypothetical protein